MNTNKEVDSWFADFEHPHKDAMLRIREIILGAEGRMTESVKWSAPTFSFEGNLASFQPRTKKLVSLMFHRGSEIPGEHPRLEGDAALVRVMRFKDLNDVEGQQKDIEAVVRAWCNLKAG